MSKLAVITARGGSKRIPRKNIKNFCGKPIVAYSIEAALQSDLFDEVMVSTDDEEIASIAQSYGANVPFLRSADTSNDFATTADVLLEVLADYSKKDLNFDVVCCIYPTAPFVTPEKLKEASELLKEDVDTVVAMTSFSFPPQRGFVEQDGVLSFWQPENALVRSQDLEPIYHDAGQFYFCRTAPLLKSKCLCGPKTAGYLVPETEVQDIDNQVDWDLAEMKYERTQESHEFN